MKTHINQRKPRSVFERSLPIVAAALGRLCGVSVELGAQVPSTNGKTIYMPMPGSMTLDEELKTLGFLCHEAGHVRFTDFSSLGKKISELEHAVDNALEDCRIEGEMRRLYPGAEMLFEKANRARAHELASCRHFDERVLLPLYLLAATEEKVLHRPWLRSLVENLEKLMHRAFGVDLTTKVAAIAMEVENARSTADVVALRKRILRLIKGAAADLDAAMAEPAVGTRREVSANEANADAESNAAEAEDASASKNRRSESEQDAKADSLNRLLSPGTKPIVNPLDISGAFTKLKSHQSVCGLTIDLSGRIRPVPAHEEIGLERLKRARQDSVVLRLALRGLVQAKAQTGRRIGDRGRRLSSSRLYRLAVSDARVFETRVDRQAPNAAVHILLDMSGSMGLAGGDLAVRSSLGLFLGLESIRGVNPALTVFPGAACGHSQHAVCTVVRHGERLSRTTPGEIGGITSWGGTPLEEALQAAGFSLALCREAKKAVLLITDGRVNSEANRQVIEEMTESGIRVLGIQIGDADDLKNLLADSAHIESVADLQRALFGFAKQILL